jgi:hypothetical protein
VRRSVCAVTEKREHEKPACWGMSGAAGKD